MQPQLLDLTGLKCPIPAIRTKRALSLLRAGQQLRVICTDPLARIDIPFLLNQTGHTLRSCDQDGLVFTFLIDVT
jgi:tRNA 2-thiouridine synthesizing protein A